MAPSFAHVVSLTSPRKGNRFAALMEEAEQPQVSNSVPAVAPPLPSTAIIPPTTLVDEVDDNGPWIIPARRNKKHLTSASSKHTVPPPAIQIPKVIPSQVPDKEFPGEATGVGVYKFSVDCRIKAGLNESVSPSRLLQGLMTIFQHVAPKSVLTSALFDAKGCPMLLDPLLIPKTYAQLTPFVAFWKQVQDELFFCRFHVISETPFEIIKTDPIVIAYLKAETIVLEKAILVSSDLHLVGFLVNIIPDDISLPIQQRRFEQLLKNLPGFQLVVRKLTFKMNSKLWCNVLKVRVDRADADEISIALNLAAHKTNEFKYYAFDEYSTLHDNQKRFIIETQRNFLQQNRSVVIEWLAADIPNLVMWEVSETVTNNQTNQETNQQERTAEPMVVETGEEKPPIFNNLNLMETTIDDFVYSYTSGDGVPLVRYMYPIVEGQREILVSRVKRTEVNSLLKVLFREMIRNMSEISRARAFPNGQQELFDEVGNTGPWTPSTLTQVVPHSTTLTSRNKRRLVNAYQPSGTNNQYLPPTVSTSSRTQSGPTTPVADRATVNSASAPTDPSAASTSEELNQVKAQMLLLQQQHTKLYENVQQLHKTQAAQHSELQSKLDTSQVQLQTQVGKVIESQTDKVLTRMTNQYQESLAELRRETQAIDQKHTAATKQLKTELTSEIALAISSLTNVVSDMRVDQTRFIQQYISDKEQLKQEQTLQSEQFTLFMNHVKASGTPVDIHPSTQHKDDSMNKPVTPEPMECTAETQGVKRPATRLEVLPNPIKKGGRGGGRCGPRDLRQQLLSLPLANTVVAHFSQHNHPPMDDPNTTTSIPAISKLANPGSTQAHQSSDPNHQKLDGEGKLNG